jgi:hypothetical protein
MLDKQWQEYMKGSGGVCDVGQAVAGVHERQWHRMWPCGGGWTLKWRSCGGDLKMLRGCGKGRGGGKDDGGMALTLMDSGWPDALEARGCGK